MNCKGSIQKTTFNTYEDCLDIKLTEQEREKEKRFHRHDHHKLYVRAAKEKGYLKLMIKGKN